MIHFEKKNVFQVTFYYCLLSINISISVNFYKIDRDTTTITTRDNENRRLTRGATPRLSPHPQGFSTYRTLIYQLIKYVSLPIGEIFFRYNMTSQHPNGWHIPGKNVMKTTYTHRSPRYPKGFTSFFPPRTVINHCIIITSLLSISTDLPNICL